MTCVEGAGYDGDADGVDDDLNGRLPRHSRLNSKYLRRMTLLAMSPNGRLHLRPTAATCKSSTLLVTTMTLALRGSRIRSLPSGLKRLITAIPNGSV